MAPPVGRCSHDGRGAQSDAELIGMTDPIEAVGDDAFVHVLGALKISHRRCPRRCGRCCQEINNC